MRPMYIFKNNHVIPPFRSRSLLRTGRMETQNGIHIPSKVLNSTLVQVLGPKKDQVRSHQTFQFPFGRLSPVNPKLIPELINLRNARQLAPFTVGMGFVKEWQWKYHTAFLQFTCRYVNTVNVLFCVDTDEISRRFRTQPQSTVP